MGFNSAFKGLKRLKLLQRVSIFLDHSHNLISTPTNVHIKHFFTLTLNPLTWKIWRAPNNASRLQMGFNSAFKGLKHLKLLQHVSIFLDHSHSIISTSTNAYIYITFFFYIKTLKIALTCFDHFRSFS